MRDNTGRQLSVETRPVRRGGLKLAIFAVVPAVIAIGSPASAGSLHAAAQSGSHPSRHPAAGRHHHHRRHRHHHAGAQLKRITVDGMVSSVHHRHVTVFATSSTVGRHTTRNHVVHLVLGRHTKRDRHLRKGYLLHLVASGRGSIHHLRIPRLRKEHLAPSPAAVVVGIVEHVSPGSLVVSQSSRDDGDHSRGSAPRAVTVDTSEARVTVDGAAGKVAPGDSVAVLGEAVGGHVLAARVFALSGEVESLRGVVTAISGDAVTVRSEGGETTFVLGSADTEVPLLLDGAPATADQLRVHDRLVVLGYLQAEEESFVPVVAFGFDGHDRAPCGQNDLPRRHHHH
jgi:hypothetical protein